MANILLCDDAMFVRQALRKILEPAGHTIVEEAASGKECIEKFLISNPDLILMDITMEEMDGIEATSKIKQINPNVKIIMVSAMGQQEKVFQAIASGASDFIVKPFQPDTVIQCVKKYF